MNDRWTLFFRDGDWFRKFLDSGEQGLVTLHLFTDVVHRGGPTYICEDGLKHMIKWSAKFIIPHGNIHQSMTGCMVDPKASRKWKMRMDGGLSM